VTVRSRSNGKIPAGGMRPDGGMRPYGAGQCIRGIISNTEPQPAGRNWTYPCRKLRIILDRQCPKCAKHAIPVTGLIVSSCYCPECGALVGVHWFFRSVFFIVILLITVPSTLAVLMQQGFYAAILWTPFPIGALGYIKAKFCPLAIKRRRDDSRHPSDA
jgi:hypothetical protein